MKTILLVLFLPLTAVEVVLADSPLTSTNFSKVYYDNDFVQVARKANGQLTPELMGFLIDSEITIDVKMAIINELGWSISGKNSYQIFLEYLVKNKVIKSKSKIKNASAGIILSLAYLKAMDNYFDVKKAIKLAEMAKTKISGSYTANLITALIQAQQAMGGDWCKVYRLTNDVRQNKDLTRDMRPEASEIIFEYMDAYKHDCK